MRNTSAFDGTIVDDLTEGFSRTTGYGYATRALNPTLTLTVGITYDRIEFPATLTDPPFISGKETRDQLGPKFGMVWTPAPNWTGRAAFSRVQTGFNIDEPVRLEPNQVAGFIQAFRSVIPQNLTGSLPAAQIDTYNVGLEGKIGQQTYLGLGFFFADSEVKRTRGSFFRPSVGATITTLGVQEAFAYEEVKVSARIDRLIGDRFSSGIQIQWNRAQLNKSTPDLPAGIAPFPEFNDVAAELFTLRCAARWQHPQGWFASAEVNYWSQDNQNYLPDLPDDEFLMINLFLGYRLTMERGEVSIGLLNLLDENYRINPLSNFNQLPREFTVLARARVSF